MLGKSKKLGKYCNFSKICYLASRKEKHMSSPCLFPEKALNFSGRFVSTYYVAWSPW